MVEESTPTLQPGSESTKVLAHRATWERGEFPDLAPMLSASPTPRQAADLVISEQFFRWRKGDRRRIASYVEQYPSLRSDPAALLSMLRAEMVLRREHHEEPTAGDYAASFPELSSQIDSLFESAPGEEAAVEATMAVSDAALWKARGKVVAADAPQISGYELIEELGRGGMGVVFRARQLLADREVALKIIRPDTLALLDPEAREGVIRRFGAEARAAAKLNHDHIVPVYDIGECRGFHYYTMKLVEGPSLSSLLREKPLDERSAARYCREASLGVHAAHEQGILHRDIKPSNVMLDKDTHRALVADFGLAKIATEGREQMTRSGDVVGTPAYMPPEQSRDSSTVTAQSDVYSLGATLYHAITGRPPFQAASLGEILRQIEEVEPIAPRRLNPRIHRDIETICLKAMQKAPAQRYATARDLADDLQRFLEGRPILARPVSLPEVVWRWCKRNPQLSSAIGAAATLALVALISIVVGYIQTSVALAASKRRLEKSLSLVDELFTKVSEDDLLNEPGMQVVRKQLLERARTHYDDLLKDSGNLPIAREALAEAHYRFGRISLELGDTAVARRELDEAERRQRLQLAAAPENPDRLLALANTLIESAQVRQASDEYERMKSAFREALSLRQKALAYRPTDRELQRQIASARMNLGTVLRDSGELEAARNELSQAQRQREQLLEQDATLVTVRRDYAKGAYNLGLLYLRVFEESQKEEARLDAQRQFVTAETNFGELAKQQPRIQSHAFNLAISLRLKATISDQPEEDYEKAAEVLRRLMDQNPDVIEYRIEAGALEQDRGAYLASVAKREDAVAAYRTAEILLSPLAESKAGAAELLAMCLLLRGEIEIELGRRENAESDLALSAKWWKALLQQTQDDPYLKENLHRAENLLADLRKTP